MNYRMIFRTQGIILMTESVFLFACAVFAALNSDKGFNALLMSAFAAFSAGIVFWFFFRKGEKTLHAREGFAAVAIAWIFLSLFGALPFAIGGTMPSYTDALFETISGFTTTGATVATDIEGMPRSIQLWRCFTHWLGGMGILAFVTALIPKMGGAGYLMRAESPGPEFARIQPKIRNTALILYIIYLGLTLTEFVALMIAGMRPFDAFTHAISTAGTGGFNNYSNSVAYFDSAAIDIVITVFMVLFGVNFSLYFRLLIGDFKSFFKSEELRCYLGFFSVSALLVAFFVRHVYGSFVSGLRYAFFTIASTMSTTGFCNTNFDTWPHAAKMIIAVMMFVGGCAGSTAGGMKVVRIVLMIKQGTKEIRHTFQPRRVSTIRFEGRKVDSGTLHSVAIFFFTYIALFLLGSFLVSICGQYDLETNVSAALTCLCNVGPGFAHVGPIHNFAGYAPFAKYVLMFLMLAGRLELFPMLVLIHPALWNRAN